MNVLVINEFLQKGGAESQTLLEIRNYQKHDYNVVFVTFDSLARYHPNESFTHVNIPCSFFWVSKIFNKFFVNPFIFLKIRKIIVKNHIDFIHVNGVYKCPITIYKIASRYPSIQTIHDYSSVCFKSTCIKSDCADCLGAPSTRCRDCINGPKLFAKYLFWKTSVKKRKSSFRAFITPSKALALACGRNGYKNVFTIGNPTDFSLIKKTEITFSNPHIFLFYGHINLIKGVPNLLRAFFLHIQRFPQTKLFLIGDVDLDGDDLLLFQGAMKDNEHFQWFNLMPVEKIMDLYARIYCVIAPSLWLENYPGTVVEAIANKTLVIGSNRGGIPELIKDSDLLFDPTDISSIVRVLSFAEHLSKEEYGRKVFSAYQKLQETNNEEIYFSSLSAIIREITKSKE